MRRDVFFIHSSSACPRLYFEHTKKPAPPLGSRVIKAAGIYFAFLLIMHAIGCHKPSEVKLEEGLIELSVVDTGSREVYLKLQRKYPRGTVTITRNGKPAFIFTSACRDTIIVDEELSSSTKYYYRAAAAENNYTVFVTPEIAAVTLGVSNNNFLCSLDTIGVSGHVWDVCMINERNVWITGMFYYDSLDSNNQRVPVTYNALKWNGEKWEYYNMYSSCYDDNGKEAWLSKSELFAVYAFSENDVWFSNGLQLVHWDGKKNTRVYIGPEFYRKTKIMSIWGTATTDMYCGGTNGYIIHSDGSRMTRMTTNTDNHIWKIFGLGNEVYAAAGLWEAGRYEGGVLKLENSQWKTMIKGVENSFNHGEYLKTQLRGMFQCGTCFNDNSFFIGGYFMYKYTAGKWENVKHMPYNNIDSIITDRTMIAGMSGNTAADLMLCGWGNFLWHYNGKEWKNVYRKYDINSTPSWRGIAFKKNAAFIIGNDGVKAYVLRVYRY